MLLSKTRLIGIEKKIINGWRREREMASYNKMAASILPYNNYEVWPKFATIYLKVLKTSLYRVYMPSM